MRQDRPVCRDITECPVWVMKGDVVINTGVKASGAEVDRQPLATVPVVGAGSTLGYPLGLVQPCTQERQQFIHQSFPSVSAPSSRRTHCTIP
jgi:hypothetical protein